MRQLHVVALSEDGRFLLLAPTKDAAKGTFKVPLDSRLTAALRGELPRPGSTTPPASDLTPKQIQARLRAGESVEQIARSAGVPVARVERFAGPVEGERARTIDAARAAVLTRARRGDSAVSLGDAVTAHLEEAGVDPAEVEWSARREDDGAWLVEAGFSVRGRKKRSTWRYEPSSRELTATDASSAVLGYVEPPDGRPVAKVVAAVRSTGRRRPAAAARPAARARSAAAPKVPAAAKAPAAAKKATPAPKKATAAKAPAAASKKAVKAPAAKAPRVRAPAKKAPATKAPAKKAVVRPVPAAAKSGPASRAAAARKTPVTRAAPERPPQLRVVPPPQDEPRSRASVPGWADVLLSTTPPSRPASREPADD